jgi:kynureninase
MIDLQATLADAKKMDEQDELRHFRDQFCWPQPLSAKPVRYLLGHSLGLQPITAATAVQQELNYWAQYAAEAHFSHTATPWVNYHQVVTDHLAELVQSKPGEVVAMNTLTTNLHLMLVSFYRPTSTRYKILIEEHTFPSDVVALQSQLAFHGFDPTDALLIVPQDKISDVLQAEGQSIAVVLLGAVNYLTGYFFDIAQIAAVARAQGCVLGLDLAHAIGNVMLHLHEWQVDFAVWCSYKYLNAGPGAIGGAFVHEKHHGAHLPRFAGWWGQPLSARFAIAMHGEALHSAEGWQLSNPCILSLASLRASLAIFHEARLVRLRTKSEQLTNYLEFLLAALIPQGLTMVTTATVARRGCQLSFTLPSAHHDWLHELKQQGVFCDVRQDSVFRVAPVPLYTTFVDVYCFVDILKQLLLKSTS